MISAEQVPVLVVVVPLLSAFAISIAGLRQERYCYPLTLIATGGTLLATLAVLSRVLAGGAIQYRLGGWPPPFGIEYVIDYLNAPVLVIVAAVAFLTAIFSKESVKDELPEKVSYFYTLYVLLVTGLLGMTITGDAFNLYVLLEISALTAYALIALGGKQALFSTFNYIILGTIGASFYLLGVGHLYIMTGSLNMADLFQLLPGHYASNAILVAFLLILIGAWAKMAFFPLHGWLPNAYTDAPSATSCLVAPLMTKVSIYVMIRIMFSVFSPDYVYTIFGARPLIVWMACLAIVAGSLLALAQTRLKRMLTYLIVAEVGYMVGGVWLANRHGITGAVLHIVNDALMTLCLFLAAAAIRYKTRGDQFENLLSLYRKMPITMAAFTVGALSMIGVPPTAGFFSKWYLILGALDAGHWGFMAALIFSSLINAVLFFRIIEFAYFGPLSEHHTGSGRHGPSMDEAPISMLAPLLAVSAGLIIVGLYTREIVTGVIQYAVPSMF